MGRVCSGFPKANRASERNGELRAFRRKLLNFVSVLLNLKCLAEKSGKRSEGFCTRVQTWTCSAETEPMWKAVRRVQGGW